jgi:hypothetical protein
MKKLKLYPWIITVLILVTGGVLLFFELVDYGMSFFAIFPFAAGFSIGTLDTSLRKRAGTISLILGLIAAFVFLIAFGFEGWICVVMALPLFAAFMLLGYWPARMIMKRFSADAPVAAKIIVAPLLILLLSNVIESALPGRAASTTVTTSIVLPYTPDVVFDGVKAMEKLDADKPLLLALGLPAPYKCELESNSVGAKRTCFFENGKIISELTDYQPGKHLEMRVTEYTLTGNQWFTFDNAAYVFEANGNETKLTRTTSYHSTLKPRFYWEWFEIMAIEQEHEFVLASLKKNLYERSTDSTLH